MGDIKSLPVRIKDDTKIKLRSIAKYYGRSANSHILFLIRQDIENFEKEHGKLDLPPEK